MVVTGVVEVRSGELAGAGRARGVVERGWVTRHGEGSLERTVLIDFHQSRVYFMIYSASLLIVRVMCSERMASPSCDTRYSALLV